MARVIRVLLLAALLAASPAVGQERLAVLEFFGRPAGQYCRDAAPTVIALQHQYAGRAILLEYDYDRFPSGRVDRFWAARTGGGTVYLPLVVVGSGFRIASGPVNFDSVYRSMLDAELARPPQAEVAVWSRRLGNALRVYVRARNLSASPLTAANSAGLWLLAWEDLRRGLTDTWVRAAVAKPLTTTLPPGATVTATVDTPSLTEVDWGALRSLVLLEHRPAGTGPYDMLQAALAAPAGLNFSPPHLVLTPLLSTATLSLDGPPVLSWTATADVPWLALQPTAGTLPATLSVTLGAGAPAGATAEVQLSANGDGMSFTVSVPVRVEVVTPRLRRRIPVAP